MIDHFAATNVEFLVYEVRFDFVLSGSGCVFCLINSSVIRVAANAGS